MKGEVACQPDQGNAQPLDYQPRYEVSFHVDVASFLVEQVKVRREVALTRQSKGEGDKINSDAWIGRAPSTPSLTANLDMH